MGGKRCQKDPPELGVEKMGSVDPMCSFNRANPVLILITGQTLWNTALLGY